MKVKMKTYDKFIMITKFVITQKWRKLSQRIFKKTIKSTSDEKYWWLGGIDLLIMLKCQDKQIKISHKTVLYEILKQSIAH